MIVDIPNKGKFDLRDGGPWADAFGNAGSVFYLESEQKFYTIETKGISMGIKLGAPILSSCSCNRGVPKGRAAGPSREGRLSVISY